MSFMQVTNQTLLEQVIQSVQHAHKIHLVDVVEGRIRIENVIQLVNLKSHGIDRQADVILTVPMIIRQIGTKDPTPYRHDDPTYRRIIMELCEVSNLATFEFRNMVEPSGSLGSIQVTIYGDQPVSLSLEITSFEIIPDGVQQY